MASSSGKRRRQWVPMEKLASIGGGPKPQTYDYLAVLDFEATCDDERGFNPQEIIEFPTVLINGKTFEIEAEFQQYVRPVHNPILTAFCKDLTGIQQEWVDNGLEFRDAFKAYEKWLTEKGLLGPEAKSVLFITCGEWDFNSMLPRQLALSGLPRPQWSRKWCNIKRAFNKLYNVNPGGMGDMLKRLDLTLDGRHHSGIDDCRNIAKIVKRMLSDGFIFEPTSSA